MSIQRVFYVILTVGLFTQPQHGMHREKLRLKILSYKNWKEPKTVIFTQVKAMHKLSTDYRLLCLIPTASLSRRAVLSIAVLKICDLT